MQICRPLLLLTILWATVAAQSATPSKAPPKAQGLTPKGSCAVCGMYVANFPDWASVVSFRDGAQAWFDGPKDLFTYLLDLKRYAPKKNPADITSIQVKDYYGLKPIDGRKAFYVLGSDVLGPMGKELVPFALEASARTFLKDHRGQRVLTFQDINPELMKGLE
jgi:nitrous oxide reductase accessory protein NosL